MQIEFTSLAAVEKAAVIDLMNDPRVRRHMPLLTGRFGDREYAQFIASKQQLWAEHGYGPWAFVSQGEFVGWGGLQPQDDDADLALVLRPAFWGSGRAIYQAMIAHAFDVMGMDSVTALLPTSRARNGGLERLGFLEEDHLHIGHVEFVRYRLAR